MKDGETGADPTEDGPDRASAIWIDALRAAALLAVDPWGLGGAPMTC